MIDHFNMKARPFTRELSTQDCLSLPFLDEQITQLIDAVKMRMSALIIGPPGLGKTVVLRRIKEGLPEARYDVRYLKVTGLSGRDLCREISHAIGAKSAGSYPALVRVTQQRIEEISASEGRRPVLLFDDAHALRNQGFELLKILSNFEMDSKLVVSYVLAGHLSLKDRLSSQELADVRQRIIHCGQLRLLSREETNDYLVHRLRLVGCTTIPFDGTAIEAIYELSRGNMRAIDNLALKSLNKAATAKEKTVGNSHVINAGAELWT